MKHIFNTLLSLVTICLPGCIFAQNLPLPEWVVPYITPHKVLSSAVQERNNPPVLLTDSSYFVSYNGQTGLIDYSAKDWSEYDAEDRLSIYTSSITNSFTPESTERILYFYNSSGKIALAEVETKDGANWIAKGRRLYTYDNNNYLIEINRETYITGEMSRTTYQYNANGFVLENKSENLFNGVWKIRSKTNYERNSDNKPTVIKDENYDLQTGGTLTGIINIFEYDIAGNQTLIIFRKWDINSLTWVNQSKSTSTYTPNNLLATSETSSPSSANPIIWEPVLRQELKYVNQTELDSVITYNRTGTSWNPIHLKLHQYAGGQLIKDSLYVVSDNQWYLSSRTLYKAADDIYSIAFGVVEGTERQDYNSGEWITNSILQEEYSDLGNNLVQLEYLFRSVNAPDFNVLDTGIYFNIYYHRIFPVSTNEALTNQSSTLAPNPYKIGQTIRCIGLENSTDLTFSLYDIAGALISEQTFDGGTGLVLPAKVKAGMYIAVISQGAQRLKTTKIVVVDAP